jgi:hypothetical protein
MGTTPVDVALAALTTQVTASVGVETSAVTLISGFASLIADNSNDPAAINALAAQMQTSAAALAAAVAANPGPTPPASAKK